MQLRIENLERPLVDGDVVQRENEDMFVRREAHENRLQHRIGAQVEAITRRVPRDPIDFTALRCGRYRTQIYEPERRPVCIPGYLHGLAVDETKRRSQRRVPSDDRADAAFEHRRIERPR